MEMGPLGGVPLGKNLADEDSTFVVTTKVESSVPLLAGGTVGTCTTPRSGPPHRLTLNLCGYHKGPSSYALLLDASTSSQSPGLQETAPPATPDGR